MNFNTSDLFRVAWFTPGRKGWGLPLLLWGQPGTAKTSLIERAAKAFGLDCEVLSPGERGEGAFGVTPVPAMDNKSICYPAPDWADRFMDTAKRGVVFVDELNTASPAIQPPLLGLLNERRIGGSYLGHGTRLIGAANDIADAAGAWELPAALANRMGHLAWSGVSQEDWSEFMLDGASLDTPQAVNPAELEAKVSERWPTAWAMAASLVTGFTKASSASFHKMPNSGDPDASKAWPSGRTWELAARALAGIAVHRTDTAPKAEQKKARGRAAEVDSDEAEDAGKGWAGMESALVAAFVGHGTAKAFFEYKKRMDLPDPAALLDGKITFTPDPGRLDQTMVVVRSCAALIVQSGATVNPKLRAARTNAFWRMVSDEKHYPTDLIFVAAKSATRAGLHTAEAADPVLERIGPMLRRAGLAI